MSSEAAAILCITVTRVALAAAYAYCLVHDEHSWFLGWMLFFALATGVSHGDE